ncbi:hypothetical protein TCAL_09757 [Tigriopus californicus]|uniref:F5/8 type C domain-containing protein n=1 Tax=Tigriopus californicus TaxID=6832 RepID=A0A553PC75_TIGCA|nr:uncharacterized protein LOC131892956 [Tigriopus californicus]TRY75287.1 hypothetical protein TCAL_09757 [Tigriopus californicus]|eukprot:TCALIF_09757-PA protein Name:"Similar to HSPB11 Intraflagellar transport protein 25 homolog (Homo sapiens)" AED:0.81 eAED:0.81 QI:164/0.5/0.4/0.6/1/1/5/0/367
MEELALEDAGTRVTLATSHHPKYPAANVLEESGTKPWISTGMYPQTIVLTFSDLKAVTMVGLKSYNVKEIEIESSSTDRTTNFTAIKTKILPISLGSPQDHVIVDSKDTAAFGAQHIRLRITAGYDNFCAIYQLSIKASDNAGARLDSTDASPAFDSTNANEKPFKSQSEQEKKFEFSFSQPKANSGDPFVFNAQRQAEEVSKAAENFGFRVPSAKKRMNGTNRDNAETSEDDGDDDDRGIPQPSWRPGATNFDDLPLPKPSDPQSLFNQDDDQDNDDEQEEEESQDPLYPESVPVRDLVHGSRFPPAENGTVFPRSNEVTGFNFGAKKDSEEDADVDSDGDDSSNRVTTFGDAFNMLDGENDSDEL